MATVDTQALQLLRVTAARITVEEQRAGEELGELFEQAEQDCNYAKADEARFDKAIESEDRLGELLGLIESLLATARG